VVCITSLHVVTAARSFIAAMTIDQTFSVLTFGSRNGSFATVEDGNPGDGVAFGADCDATGLTLRAIPEAARRALPWLTGSRWLITSDGEALPDKTDLTAAAAMARNDSVQSLTPPRAPANIGPLPVQRLAATAKGLLSLWRM